MRLQKPLLALGFLGLGALLLNVHSFASNSYYLMSCTEQNIPTGYYDSIDTTVDEATFRETLHDVISANYVKNSYKAAWDIDYYADADPYNEGHVQCLYTDQSVENGSHISNGDKLYWNREHTWPKSHGFSDEDCAAYTDCHHLRAAESAINIAKSNNDFGEIEGTYSESFGNKYANGVFEPKDDVKGDVARMLLYMMIRYGEYDDTTMSWEENVLDEQGNVVKDEKGKNVTETKTASINLMLVDDSDTTSISNGNGRIAKLSTILSWHYQDPVSDREIYRNNVVYMFQKNRNPFIDHPEYVEYAFENSGNYQGVDPIEPESPDTEVRTNEFLVDSTGFESTEGFTATSTASDYYKQYSHKTNFMWSGYQAVASTVSKISGSQSMRLTVAKNSLQQAQFFMLEDVYNLSRITFKAKASQAGSVLHVMYSTDSGLSWQEGQSYNLTTSAKSYSFELSANGGYDKARIGFFFEKLNTEGLSYVNIDDLAIYRYKTNAPTEFVRDETKSSLFFNYTAETITVQGYNYHLVKNTSEIGVGKEVIITALDYVTYPYAMGDARTNNFAKVDTTIKDEIIKTEGSANVLTIGNGSTSGTFSLKTINNKYLGNGSSKDNNLKEYDSVSSKQSWTIEIDPDTYSAVITLADESIGSRILMYNNGNSVFSCYKNTMLKIALFVKVTGSHEEMEYTYSNMHIRFGAIIDKEIFDALLELDGSASFGVALSKDGLEFTNYECNPARVSYVEGRTQEDSNGNYMQWATVIPVSDSKYEEVIFAKAYVIINGTTYYMNEAEYSVKTLVRYYIDHAEELDLTEEQVDMLMAFIA